MNANSNAIARLVRDRGGVRFALPVHTTLEILDNPKPVRVPGSPPHALGLLAWQDRHIALIDVARLVTAAGPRTQPPRYALVVAFQTAPGNPVEHGAIALDSLPDTIAVSDAAACALPEDEAWETIALSCFEHGGERVPVADAARLLATVGLGVTR